MKKILCLVLVALILVTGCNLTKKEGKLTEISFSKFEEKIEKEDSFVLLVWRTGCAHCELFEPKLKQIIGKYNLKIYSINLTELTETENAKLENKTFVKGTPTTLVFEKGKRVDGIVGNKEEKDVIEFLKNYGYIGE